jgi:plasmid stabilization system protein ParE
VSYSIALRVKAEKAIDRAAGWYHRRNPDAARAFLDAVDSTLQRVAENPHQFPRMGPKLRRAAITGFPYSLLFKARETEVLVTMCAHFRRDPKRWGIG